MYTFGNYVPFGQVM